ncbi:flagellar biosynthesis anti-sigma factor FlgM [Undibacterium oligocarboniphilum]|uniref:Negative regulator of flagellin synthesis n=1 Tax=Undibacterium oligocarboniphilum TaxID=666702 RepID=A0A850QPX8_9BURK|nr:flagellar biosynthesis anti-sigma factor FlgM [Undibacterium oligocarboniphilum]MBC3870145.1 flagellar biosynthesis anti-sigma factor FlgM [Undibacterium oligocarboniphilum]NVO78136.1 flagellar biosynthesis anti-sigma factor FlgM [Undibacterium oligocarboniphilum]
MKIDDTLNKTAGLTNTASPQQVRTDKAPDRAISTPTPSSNVQISTLSTQLQAMQSTQASNAVFETKKVEEIKLAISEGRFQVNSEKVADGLLETVKDLLNARKR